jgi:hypothetical protein
MHQPIMIPPGVFRDCSSAQLSALRNSETCSGDDRVERDAAI